MQEMPMHFAAMGAAAAVKFVSGAIWYSPVAFARPWQRLTGVGDEGMKAACRTAIPVDAIGCLLMSFVLAHAVFYAGAATFAEGAAVGFFNWLGFVAVVTVSANRWERRPLKLFLLNNGQLLLSLVAMGGILAAWKS